MSDNDAVIEKLEELKRRFKACTCKQGDKPCSGWMTMHIVQISRPEHPAPVFYWICDLDETHTSPVSEKEIDEYNKKDPEGAERLLELQRPCACGGWILEGD